MTNGEKADELIVLLSGKALEWVTAVWESHDPVFSLFEDLVEQSGVQALSGEQLWCCH